LRRIDLLPKPFACTFSGKAWLHERSGPACRSARWTTRLWRCFCIRPPCPCTETVVECQCYIRNDRIHGG
jgi:hypothetical protein